MPLSLSQRVRASIDSAKTDIDLALRQCTTAAALKQRCCINAVQVARAFVDAVEGGIALPGDICLALPFARPLSDEDAIGLWAMFVAPFIRNGNPTRLKARSGTLDFLPQDVRDSLNEDDRLEYQRRIAGDWSDLFRLLIEALDGQPKKRRATKRNAQRDRQLMEWADADESLSAKDLAARWNVQNGDDIGEANVRQILTRMRKLVRDKV